VGQKAGCEDVRQPVPRFLPGLTAPGEVRFDESPVASGEFAKWMEGLDDARTLRPSASNARSQRDHGELAGSQ
jgi:hypothetical protein